MQDAVPAGQGAMAAVMGLDLAAMRTVCETATRPGEPVEIANINGAGQIVISGHVRRGRARARPTPRPPAPSARSSSR